MTEKGKPGRYARILVRGDSHLRSMKRVMVFHELGHLGPGCRFPIGPVFARVQLNDDGLERFPAPVVRDVEEFGVVRMRKQPIGDIGKGVHDKGESVSS